MNLSEYHVGSDTPAFLTTAASTLSAEQSQLLNDLRISCPDLWEQMLDCYDAKDVMVLYIGGYRATTPALLELLQSAHMLGVPVLLVPFQEEYEFPRGEN